MVERFMLKKMMEDRRILRGKIQIISITIKIICHIKEIIKINITIRHIKIPIIQEKIINSITTSRLTIMICVVEMITMVTVIEIVVVDKMIEVYLQGELVVGLLIIQRKGIIINMIIEIQDIIHEMITIVMVML